MNLFRRRPPDLSLLILPKLSMNCLKRKIYTSHPFPFFISTGGSKIHNVQPLWQSRTGNNVVSVFLFTTSTGTQTRSSSRNHLITFLEVVALPRFLLKVIKFIIYPSLVQYDKTFKDHWHFSSFFPTYIDSLCSSVLISKKKFYFL